MKIGKRQMQNLIQTDNSIGQEEIQHVIILDRPAQPSAFWLRDQKG